MWIAEPRISLPCMLAEIARDRREPMDALACPSTTTKLPTYAAQSARSVYRRTAQAYGHRHEGYVSATPRVSKSAHQVRRLLS